MADAVSQIARDFEAALLAGAPDGTATILLEAFDALERGLAQGPQQAVSDANADV